MDILSCNWDTAKFLIFSENVFDPLIYYSHLLPLISSIVLGFFVLFVNRRSKVNILFFLLAITFSVWVYFDLILWASEKAELIMFFWSSIVYVEYLIFVLAFLLCYAFLYKKNVPIGYKISLALLSLPLIFFAYSEYSLIAYDLTNCDREPFEGAVITYLYLTELVIFLMTCVTTILYFKNNKDNKDKKQNIIFSTGLLIFMLLFFLGNVALIYLGSSYEQYKLFGMLLFLVALLFIIVRFKTFNAKVIGAQALVWVMVILIGSQFLFIESSINIVLNSLTFVAVSIAGLVLVRSVKKVDHQKELLELANQNQESLLHFITHQVKGYMTKTRNIFDGMLSGDYGPITNDKMKEVIKHGFDSETKGVETVQAILRASDLKTGRTEFTKEPTNLSSLVAGIAEKAKEAALDKGLDFNFQIEPNLMANVDALRIGEVFKNLLDNAVIYTTKGAVHVDLISENGKIRFAVIDTGFGLTPKDKERLFTEGGKGEHSIDVNIDSTGYGLFIAKQIVQQHEGRIGARSDGRDKGSEFFVILPKMQ